MSDRIEIPAGGGNETHVFGLDLTGPEAAAFVARPQGANGAGWPLKVALGADHLVPAHVEHFPVTDLEGIGLAGYMTEGLGLDRETIEMNRDRIEAMRQDIVILRPAAFGGQAQTLNVTAPLTLVGAFPPARAATTMERLHTPSAEGSLSQDMPPTPEPTPRILKWMAAVAAFIVVVGLLLLLTGGSS